MLNIEKLNKNFEGRAGLKIQVLEDISFSVDRKEFITILAPRGSGKSTLLKVIAGIEAPASGLVKDLSGESIPNRTAITYIPSMPSSVPWLTVEANILQFLTYGGDRNSGKPEINRLIKIVGLEGYEKHIPDNNSKGFRFRIALACALAVQPKVILLDDILCSMPQKTKEEIFDLLKEIKISEDVSFILATSNLTEAVYLSDRVLIMKKNPCRLIREINIGNLKSPDITGEIYSELIIKIQQEISDLIERKHLEHNEFTFSI